MYIAQPAFGGLVAEPMVASPLPGYNSQYRIKITGGTAGGGTSAAFGQDGMANIAQLVTLKDAFGTPIIVAPGYEAFHLIPLFSGQFGIHETQDPGNLPSFTPGALTTGAFSFSSSLMWEFSLIQGIRPDIGSEREPAADFADEHQPGFERVHDGPFAGAPAPGPGRRRLLLTGFHKGLVWSRLELAPPRNGSSSPLRRWSPPTAP
jgi:hypothetical protein